MNKLIFILFPVFLNAQKYTPKYASIGTSFVSGLAWGTHEQTSNHWQAFSNRFPRANEQFFNPEISWKNKYIDGMPDKGRNRTPVILTDAKHLTASINQVSIFSSGIIIVFGDKRKWWHYALDAGISFASYNVGFYTIYKT